MIEKKIYCIFGNGTVEERAAIKKTIRYLGIIFKVMSFLYFSSLLIFALWPLYVYYTENQLVSLFSYEVPYLRIDEPTGYIILLLIQIIIYIMGICGAIVTDYMFIFVTFHALLSVDLLILNLSQLKNILTVKESEKNLTDWYVAYFFLLLVSAELTICFILGNAIELKIDELFNAVTSLPWHLLSLFQQKDFIFLLARQQRPLILTIYGFVPLNFETYTTVYFLVLRALYQFFVLLLQYLE
ncbi:uncharacterized protein LOC129728220 [Wyeomyia smithii]|uniref:uncharacterized protein LOC129728220 n=1 Tax=Wyeomyia smithii TaxID=174621 RepID=UPI002467ADB9|nr:uncharacterized protein LOC129728220 [Wyeomyia smithii]